MSITSTPTTCIYIYIHFAHILFFFLLKLIICLCSCLRRTTPLVYYLQPLSPFHFGISISMSCFLFLSLPGHSHKLNKKIFSFFPPEKQSSIELTIPSSYQPVSLLYLTAKPFKRVCFTSLIPTFHYHLIPF